MLSSQWLETSGAGERDARRKKVDEQQKQAREKREAKQSKVEEQQKQAQEEKRQTDEAE